LRILRRLQASGYRLAGHGWCHSVEAVRGWPHRLHSALLSRGVAEHLALDADGIAALIGRCFRWFGEHDLDPPQLYVPPAWAMGKIPRQRLSGSPFRLFETLSGIYDAATGQFMGVPLLGYEADTPARVLPLRLWNGINRLAARRVGFVRIAIHPFDPRHRLASSLHAHLAQHRGFESYAGLAAALHGGTSVKPSPGSAGRDAAPGRS
jgi:predicted deacetylase